MPSATETPARQFFDIALAPVAGARFQPTGFPDIGAAEFRRPVKVNGEVEWRDALILESAQSMANHLEGVGWDDAADEPLPVLRGLPYVRVTAADDGRYLTSSRTEAHRLASAFVKDSVLEDREMKEVIRESLGLRDDTPIPHRQIAAAVFRLDPLCLIHGVFFAESAAVWPGQPKIPRALIGFIEALDVERAISGGVKRDAVRHKMGEVGGTAEGYGTVPYHRVEYTAATITASFVIDNAQIAAYGLGESASRLLETLARWEIRALMDRGLRLRTACDLAPVDPELMDRSGSALPAASELESELGKLIAECRNQLGGGEPLEVVWGGGKTRTKKG